MISISLIGFVFGLYGVMVRQLTYDGEILSFVPTIFNRIKGDMRIRWWEKPIYACPKCVAFWHYLLFNFNFDTDILLGGIVALFTAYYFTER